MEKDGVVSPPNKKVRVEPDDVSDFTRNGDSPDDKHKEGQDKVLSYEALDEIARYIRGKTGIRPTLGVICGSGLGKLAEDLDKDKPKDTIRYQDIPGFPICYVKGHAGNLVFGYLSRQPTVCMQGRFHFYEGHPAWKVTMPVRVMKLLGVETLVVTNASGGLNAEFKMGDIMIMRDHINMLGMTGFNPLIGPNEERFGPRFPAMTSAYDKELRELTHKTAKELEMSDFIREGVYISLSGPTYETPAECRLLRVLGADSVGMSTASEVAVAKHCGMRVLGLSLITNISIVDYDSALPPPTHQEVMDTANQRAKDMQLLVKTVVGKMFSSSDPQ